MFTITRRSLLAVAGVTAVSASTTHASPSRIGGAGRPLYSCGAAVGTPEIVHVESDIPFDRAYIDTTIPYHQSALKLAELAGTDLEDDRLTEIADAILANNPSEIEELESMRKDWFGSDEPDDATHEMMLLSMGGLESCTDQSHMDFMDAAWVQETWKKNDDPLFAFVSMLVLLLEMEFHQHTVGLELADEADLKDFCQRMIEANEPRISTLKTVRGELINRH